MIGAASAGMTTLDRNTPKSTELSPAPTMAAPMRPPKSAWDDEDGRPKRQVAMFQMIAPMSPARMKSGVIWTPIAFPDDPAGDGLGHLRGEEGTDEVEDRGESDRRFGFDRSRGDRSGHGIGCIVKAIGEVEEQCQCYDKHDDEDDFH